MNSNILSQCHEIKPEASQAKKAIEVVEPQRK